jgi:hypothetical protein
LPLVVLQLIYFFAVFLAAFFAAFFAGAFFAAFFVAIAYSPYRLDIHSATSCNAANEGIDLRNFSVKKNRTFKQKKITRLGELRRA